MYLLESSWSGIRGDIAHDSCILRASNVNFPCPGVGTDWNICNKGGGGLISICVSLFLCISGLTFNIKLYFITGTLSGTVCCFADVLAGWFPVDVLDHKAELVDDDVPVSSWGQLLALKCKFYGNMANLSYFQARSSFKDQMALTKTSK